MARHTDSLEPNERRSESTGPTATVVVAARNAMATLPRALDAITSQATSRPYEVVVVDDGSTDETFEYASAYGPHVRAVRNTRVRGPGNARNLGVENARADVIAFTDSDCFPEPDWLERGLQAMEFADLVQGAVRADQQAERRPFDRTVIVDRDDGYFRTANLFVRRTVFEDVGGFEDWVVESGGDPPFGWRAPADGRPTVPARKSIGEDSLFGWQARRLGARVGFAADVKVSHAVFPTSAWDSIKFRWHWRHMAGVVKLVPELREHAFFARMFFSRRTAGFDLAVLGIGAYALTRRPYALAAVLPYARWVYQGVRAYEPKDAPRVLLGTIAQDAAALGSFAVGSVAWRSPVL